MPAVPQFFPCSPSLACLSLAQCLQPPSCPRYSCDSILPSFQQLLVPLVPIVLYGIMFLEVNFESIPCIRITWNTHLKYRLLCPTADFLNYNRWRGWILMNIQVILIHLVWELPIWRFLLLEFLYLDSGGTYKLCCLNYCSYFKEEFQTSGKVTKVVGQEERRIGFFSMTKGENIVYKYFWSRGEVGRVLTLH